MRVFSIIIKSVKEQLRNFWVLLLTLAMGPFFILVYYLITESYKLDYTVLIVNEDIEVPYRENTVNLGSSLIDFAKAYHADTMGIPLTIVEALDQSTGIDQVKQKKADALVVIRKGFTAALANAANPANAEMPEVEFFGDLTNTSYLISAVWANEIMYEFTRQVTNTPRTLKITESPLGVTGSADEFDLMVPGLLIISLIMLMFTASIAFVSEVEHKTMLRLKLSGLKAYEFLTGISLVEGIIGILSVFLTLLTAVSLGFQFSGAMNVLILLLVAGLTSLSIIGFSLIIAAVTRSANEVLVVGNFPMFLFMFFTGGAFPLQSDPLFDIGGYPLSLQSLMSPTHAISALNKTLILGLEIGDIVPELISLGLLTIVYFIIGGLAFRRRHLRMSN
ncbi:MAG TPA: ABC transporter permease [Saprospiraceae bacterium]|nr:ABC transporter permease [Saprospiraceae bacterium]